MTGGSQPRKQTGAFPIVGNDAKTLENHFISTFRLVDDSEKTDFAGLNDSGIWINQTNSSKDALSCSTVKRQRLGSMLQLANQRQVATLVFAMVCDVALGCRLPHSAVHFDIENQHARMIGINFRIHWQREKRTRTASYSWPCV